jgi:RNA polymerase sigma-70 factor (ECF subfamily)
MSSPRTTTLNLTAPLAAAATAGVNAHDKRLRALVDRHLDFIGRMVRHLGVADLEIDDVLQQVFCTAARRLGDIAPGSERAFLVQTAVNWAANARRARARRPEVGMAEVPDVADEAPSPEDLTDRKRAVAVLDRLLDTMELELRTVFVLFEVEQLSRNEIAELVGLPPGTVASRLRRAREDFETRLARWRRGQPGSGDSNGGVP